MKNFSWLKAVFFIVALAFLGMIYWSSSLIENDLKAIRREIKELKTQTATLGQKIRLGSLHEDEKDSAKKTEQLEHKYPNLLQEDHFFTKTVPRLVGEDFQPKGTLHEAFIGKPDHLHPFNNFKDISRMWQMCVVQVADLQFGKYETMAPDMAVRLEARPRPDKPEVQEYWVFLRDDVYWNPLESEHFPDALALAPWFLERHKVTAHDFKFFFNAIMNPYVSEPKAASLRTYYNDIESFTVVDDYTFVVRWKPHKLAQDKENYKVKYTSLSLTGALQPLPRFVYQYFADGKKIIEEGDDPNIYQKDSIWAQNFMHHFAKNVIPSCGAYIFAGMNEEGITFRRNPDHYNPYAVLVEEVQFRFKESGDAIWQDFKAGKLDICTLSPNQLSELDVFLKSEEYKAQQAKNQGIKSLDYVDLSYFYLGWNSARPYFTSARVRKALTMAIDRERIIEQNLNQMAISISGPFFRYSPSYDDTILPWPFNLEKAKALLEEEGWVDTDGDGIREKIIDGQKVPFRFKLFYFVKSLSAKVICEYIATSFKEIGLDCQFSGLDLADLSRQFDEKNFDALFMGWKLGTPPEDPRQLWHSSGAKEKGSSNLVGFSNKKIDSIIDQLNYEYNKKNRLTLYHEFHKIIHDEAPYTFLYTPKLRLLYREYVKNLFVPRERQDLVPGADIPEPNVTVLWIEKP